MATKVDAWRCDYGCTDHFGRTDMLYTSHHLAVEHESKCFMNPKTKSCKACRYSLSEFHERQDFKTEHRHSDRGHSDWDCVVCSHPKKNYFGDAQLKLGFDVQLMCNAGCEGWGPKV